MVCFQSNSPQGTHCEMLQHGSPYSFASAAPNGTARGDLHQWQILAVRGSWGSWDRGYHQAICCDMVRKPAKTNVFH